MLKVTATKNTNDFQSIGGAPPIDWRRGRLALRCRLGDRSAPGSKPDSTENTSCIGRVARQIVCRVSNVLPLLWCDSLERKVPVQASASSSDCGSKLRGPS
ncbi:hypothetical protein AVEN_133937-1 [Araneus ventricosus]|uniref:Uncharacterized protein n=1 Tax=Araneus ventricosus TaxID=182803 RepID=A0A4Y2D3A6_ARAVE|nr:hypothetical protein AVEN_133937-1 [Araneus ventricosus]